MTTRYENVELRVTRSSNGDHGISIHAVDSNGNDGPSYTIHPLPPTVEVKPIVRVNLDSDDFKEIRGYMKWWDDIQKGESDYERVDLSIDRAGGRAYQMAISVRDSGGYGHGFRLYGPKYIGDSVGVLDHGLTETDVREIRKILDLVDGGQDK